MRLSIHEGDPGYDPTKILGAKIFFNGEHIRHCVMADEEKGMVQVYLAGDDYRWSDATKFMYGKVEIRFPDAPAATNNLVGS